MWFWVILLVQLQMVFLHAKWSVISIFLLSKRKQGLLSCMCYNNNYVSLLLTIKAFFVYLHRSVTLQIAGVRGGSCNPSYWEARIWGCKLVKCGPWGMLAFWVCPQANWCPVWHQKAYQVAFVSRRVYQLADQIHSYSIFCCFLDSWGPWRAL